MQIFPKLGLILPNCLFSQTFYPNLQISLHGYFRHIPDISQLWTGPTNISEGGENSKESNLFLASSKQRTREINKETYSGSISEEGPDYENTRQKSSVYDAMYENWTSLLKLISRLYLVLWRLNLHFSFWLYKLFFTTLYLLSFGLVYGCFPK